MYKFIKGILKEAEEEDFDFFKPRGLNDRVRKATERLRKISLKFYNILTSDKGVRLQIIK